MLKTGTRLGPYEIESPLGAGGMGEVYRAKDTRLDRAVAIKVLPEELARDAPARSRFEREAKAVAALSHPNILALHDFSTEGEVAYAVMELLDGETLRERLASGPLSPRKAVEYATQIAQGLAAAHERGVVHRDLKPENLFVTRDERVKILDFGLAKRQVSADAETMELDDRTGAGTVLGTVGYMSPEQVRGEEVDARSDLFAFGAVLYEMLTGRRAFRGESAVETMSAILKEEPPELATTGRELPQGLDRIVRHCLEKKREVRFQSARDLAFDLEAAGFASTTGSLTPLTGEGPHSRRGWIVGAAVGAVALALVAGWAIGRAGGAGTSSGVSLEQLTRRRGTISAARFTPDGQSFVYSATWEGNPSDLYVGRIGSPDARLLGFTGATLFDVSRDGTLAIGLDWNAGPGLEGSGTLATVSLEGGAPRRLLDGVMSASWGPAGKELAIARCPKNNCQLEYPVGKVLYKADGWISDVRMSADGRRIGFIEHPNRGDNFGVVSVSDLAGHVTKLSAPVFPWGLAWSADGKYLLYGLVDGSVMAVGLRGRPRRLTSLPHAPLVVDAAPDGRVLFVNSSARRESIGLRPGSATQRNLSWFDWSYPDDLSRDGRTLLLDEQLVSYESGYAIYLRPTDGSPAVRIGEGRGLALSADGQWALVLRDPFGKTPSPTLVPTGVGEARTVPSGGIRFQTGSFLSDGKTIIGFGSRPGEEPKLYVYSLEGGARARLLTDQPVRITAFNLVISPGDEEVALALTDGRLVLQPVAGGAATPVPGATPGDVPIAFSSDGKSLYVVRSDSVPLPIDRVDLATGRRTPFTTIEPADPAGISKIGPVLMTADGSTIVYSYIRALGELFLAKGLR